MASELLVFSGCDCQILAAALRPIAPAMPMLDVLDRFAGEAGGDRFAPFGIRSPRELSIASFPHPEHRPHSL
jgi:hypothetical protein